MKFYLFVILSFFAIDMIAGPATGPTSATVHRVTRVVQLIMFVWGFWLWIGLLAS